MLFIEYCTMARWFGAFLFCLFCVYIFLGVCARARSLSGSASPIWEAFNLSKRTREKSLRRSIENNMVFSALCAARFIHNVSHLTDFLSGHIGIRHFNLLFSLCFYVLFGKSESEKKRKRKKHIHSKWNTAHTLYWVCNVFSTQIFRHQYNAVKSGSIVRKAKQRPKIRYTDTLTSHKRVGRFLNKASSGEESFTIGLSFEHRVYGCMV